MPAVSRRALTQINGNIKHRSARHPHQLVLGEGRCLKMQAAHRSLISRARVVVLHEVVLYEVPSAANAFLMSIPSNLTSGKRDFIFRKMLYVSEKKPRRSPFVLPGAQQPDIRDVQMFNLIGIDYVRPLLFFIIEHDSHRHINPCTDFANQSHHHSNFLLPPGKRFTKAYKFFIVLKMFCEFSTLAVTCERSSQHPTRRQVSLLFQPILRPRA